MSQDSIVHDDEGAVPQTLPSDPSRRFWIGTTCAVGGAAGAALAVPFVSTFAPSEKVRAAGATRKTRIVFGHDWEGSETGTGRHLAAILCSAMRL